MDRVFCASSGQINSRLSDLSNYLLRAGVVFAKTITAIDDPNESLA